MRTILVLVLVATCSCDGTSPPADGDADADSDADSDTDTDADRDEDGDADRDEDSDGNPDADVDLDADGDRDGDEDGDGDRDSDTANRAPACTCDPALQELAPMDTARFTVDCTDPDGDSLTYAWRVTSRPMGSTSMLTPAGEDWTTLFLDIATPPGEEYVVEATATDSDGASGSCQFHVTAVLPQPLRVHLDWDTDITDLDIHVLDDIGSVDPTGPDGWFSALHDCYSGNMRPGWDPAGPEGDPALDIDDHDGFGPENVSFLSVTPGTYTVGVHYYCDHEIGPTTATLQVFCDSVQVASFDQVLDASGDLWTVATIEWPGCTVTEAGDLVRVARSCPDGG